VVDKTLQELGVVGKPTIIVKNKMDLVRERVEKEAALSGASRANDSEMLVLPHADAVIEMSARTGSGIPEFYDALARILRDSRVYIDTVIDYKDSARLARIRKYGQLLSEEYEGDGIHIKAYVPRSLT